MDEPDILLQLGRILGTLDQILRRQEEMTSWVNRIDERLRAVEVKAALYGLAGGTVGGTVGGGGIFMVARHFFPG
ncbi:MAG: hypothetical protein HQL56_06850 [Magnetococcales bacterium]|nr:hypothetical protein [Magnetococcales bacterium]